MSTTAVNFNYHYYYIMLNNSKYYHQFYSQKFFLCVIYEQNRKCAFRLAGKERNRQPKSPTLSNAIAYRKARNKTNMQSLLLSLNTHSSQLSLYDNFSSTLHEHLTLSVLYSTSREKSSQLFCFYIIRKHFHKQFLSFSKRAEPFQQHSHNRKGLFYLCS